VHNGICPRSDRVRIARMSTPADCRRVVQKRLRGTIAFNSSTSFCCCRVSSSPRSFHNCSVSNATCALTCSEGCDRPRPARHISQHHVGSQIGIPPQVPRERSRPRAPPTSATRGKHNRRETLRGFSAHGSLHAMGQTGAADARTRAFKA